MTSCTNVLYIIDIVLVSGFLQQKIHLKDPLGGASASEIFAIFTEDLPTEVLQVKGST